MTRAALLFLTLALCSCVSVPLATIVKLSTFDEQDFVALNPDVVRVRITLPQGFDLDAPRSWLGVNITSPAGVHDGEFKLEQESTQATHVSTGMFSADAPATAYTLRLAAPSKKEFKDLQAFVAKAHLDQITIRVVPRLASIPKDADSGDVWIELLLTESQGFFTLLDGAEMPLDKLRDVTP